MNERHRRLRPQAWAIVLGTAIVVAACGGSTGVAPSVPAFARASPSAAATPSPTPTPSPAPTPTASPERPDTVIGETGRITVPDQSFAITLPKGWRRLKVDPASLAEIAKVFPADSEFAKLLSNQMVQIMAAGIQLWAIDVSPHAGLGGAPSNLTVVGQANSPFTLKQLKTMGLTQISRVDGISKVKATDIKLPVGQAVMLSYELKLPTTVGMTLELRGFQYYVVGSTFGYVLTFSCAKLDSLCADRVGKSMKTFEILP